MWISVVRIPNIVHLMKEVWMRKTCTEWKPTCGLPVAVGDGSASGDLPLWLQWSRWKVQPTCHEKNHIYGFFEKGNGACLKLCWPTSINRSTKLIPALFYRAVKSVIYWTGFILTTSLYHGHFLAIRITLPVHGALSRCLERSAIQPLWYLDLSGLCI